MPNIEQINNNIIAVLRMIFGNNTPSWVTLLVGWILLLILVGYGISGLLSFLSKIQDFWSQRLRPIFYDKEQRRRSTHRQNFAVDLVRRIRQLDVYEDWSDERFAELEAEIEIQGKRKGKISNILFVKRTQSGLKRERSLSIALEASKERRILLVGDPGSGKSVALRHVTQRLAEQAARVHSTKSSIPIYVNLKELVRQPTESIDKNLIERFILKSISRNGNDRDIDEFLQVEFKAGIEDGTWLFLFDSFDEIPEILSSTDVDNNIKSYGNAIDDFLGGFNKCRGIVASRHFRGPTYLSWPRFRILPLTESRRLELIQRAGLDPKAERKLIDNLDTAPEPIRVYAQNPLFLTLLCKHIKNGGTFPTKTHAVFESFIENRLNHDKERLLELYQLKTDQVRTAAENIAFCMNIDPNLSLSTTLQKLQDSMSRLGITVPGSLATFLGALKYMKLARSVDDIGDGIQSDSFTFAHRRFQEYFATCVVLRDPSLVSPKQLLTNERWRETTVTMFQTQLINKLDVIVKEADQLLNQFCRQIPNLIAEPEKYISGRRRQFIRDYFPWPQGALHLLSLLQDGFLGHFEELPSSIRIAADKILLSATEKGTLYDKKLALEVSGISSKTIYEYLLKEAFAGQSQWLKEVAYRQTALLSNIPPDLSKGIRKAILYLARTNRLRREWYATKAQIERTNQSSDLFAIMQLLLWLLRIDIGLHATLFILTLWVFLRLNLFSSAVALPLAGVLLLSHLGLRFLVSSRPSFSSILIIFLSRYTLVAALFVGLLSGFFKSDTNNYNFLLYINMGFAIYVSLFGVFAYWAAVTGKLVKKRWWILMPLWPLLYLFSFAEVVLTIVVFLLIMGVCGALLYGITWLSQNTAIGKLFSSSSKASSSQSSTLPSQSNTLPSIPKWIIQVFGILIILSITLIIIVTLYRWIHDLLTWTRWSRRYSKGHQKVMTCEELFIKCSDFYSKAYRLRLLKIVREQKDMLLVTQDTDNILSEMAITIEKRQEMDASEKAAQIESLISLGARKEYIAFVRMADPEIVDEIYMLLANNRSVLKS